MIINKTWNGFWGEFLLVTFHKDNPDKWRHIEKKAKWVTDHGTLNKQLMVLDLGCGSGMLDIALAKQGIHLTAVDRIIPVLDIARKEAGNLPVEFIHADIKQITFPDSNFNCIIILETIGLMNKEDDIKLLENTYKWLNKYGIVILDCPEPALAGPNYWEKEFNEGLLKFETTFDPEASIQTITPALINGEDTIQLYDPYSIDKGDHTGVKRYLYCREELAGIMKKIGFEVSVIPHYWGGKYYALKGLKH